MIQSGDLIELRNDAVVLSGVGKKLAGRVGTVITAWEFVNGHPAF